GARPSPEATFLDRLGERLMGTTLSAPINPNGLHALASPTAFPEIRPRPPGAKSAPRSFRLIRRIWPITELVAAVLLIVALGGVALGGQSRLPAFLGWNHDDSKVSDWPMFRGDAARTGATSGPGLVGTPELRWTFTPVGAVHPTFVVAGDAIYI